MSRFGSSCATAALSALLMTGGCNTSKREDPSAGRASTDARAVPPAAASKADAVALPAPSINTSPAPGSAPTGMVVDPRRRFLDGVRELRDAGRAAGASRVRRRVLDGCHARHQRRVRRVHEGDEVHHRRRAPARSEGLSRRATRQDRAGIGGLHASRPSGLARRFFSMVELCAGRKLAASGRTIEQPERIGAPSCRPHRVGRCDGLRDVGGEAAAHRGGVRVRRARGTGSPSLSVGERAEAGGNGFPRISGRGISPTRTAARMGISKRRRSLRSRPIATACTMWVATSGSGAPTGIGPTTTAR